MMDAKRVSPALTRCRVLCAAAIVVFAVPGCGPAAGEAEAPAAGGDATLRTAFGHPNLQGVWALQTLTPLERPAEFADRATLTEKRRRK